MGRWREIVFVLLTVALASLMARWTRQELRPTPFAATPLTLAGDGAASMLEDVRAISADGRYILTDHFTLWEVRDGRKVSRLDAPGTLPFQVALSNTGRVALKRPDGALVVWKPLEGDAVVPLGRLGDDERVLIDTGGRFVAAVDTRSHRTRVWDLLSLPQVATLAGLDAECLGRDGTVFAWRGGNKTVVETYRLLPDGSCQRIGTVDGLLPSVSDDGARLCTSSGVYDLGSGRRLCGGSDEFAIFSPDGRYLARQETHFNVKTVTVVETSSGRRLMSAGAYSSIEFFAFDGDRLLTLTRPSETLPDFAGDYWLREWDVKSGRLLAMRNRFGTPSRDLIRRATRLCPHDDRLDVASLGPIRMGTNVQRLESLLGRFPRRAGFSFSPLSPGARIYGCVRWIDREGDLLCVDFSPTLAFERIYLGHVGEFARSEPRNAIEMLDSRYLITAPTSLRLSEFSTLSGIRLGDSVQKLFELYPHTEEMERRREGELRVRTRDGMNLLFSITGGRVNAIELSWR